MKLRIPNLPKIMEMTWLELAEAHWSNDRSHKNRWHWFCLLCAAEKGEL